MFLSLIIPVYNAAPYLPSTLAPLAASLPDSCEIIAVDDGSTDGSLAILQGLDPEKVRVFSQANAGPNAARNRGLREARGQFITFLDADDTLAPGTLEAVLPYLSASPGDLLVLPLRRINADGREETNHDYTIDFPALELLSGKELRRLWCQGDPRIRGYLWGKIYSRRVLEGIVFPEEIRFAEDMYALSDILSRATSGGFFPQGAYLYFTRPNTPTTGTWTQEKSHGLQAAYLHRWEKAQEIGQPPEEQILAWLSAAILTLNEKKFFRQWALPIRDALRKRPWTLLFMLLHLKGLKRKIQLLRIARHF